MEGYFGVWKCGFPDRSGFDLSLGRSNLEEVVWHSIAQPNSNCIQNSYFLRTKPPKGGFVYTSRVSVDNSWNLYAVTKTELDNQNLVSPSPYF